MSIPAITRVTSCWYDRGAGDAHALGADIVDVLRPKPLSGVVADHTATGRQPRITASPSRAGSIRLSHPDDVAGSRTSREQAEHLRVHRVCGTSDLEIGWGYVKHVERSS